MNKIFKAIRKAYWIFHEFMSPLGHVVWLEHRLKEIEEMEDG